MSGLIIVLKILVGIALLPACWAGGAAAWGFITATFSSALPFWIGALVYLVLLGIFQQPVRTYVFGHELTHLIWVYICGGRVKGFKSGSGGGRVRATRANFLVYLAPYFFPIYSIIIIGVWGLGSMLLSLEPWRPIFGGLLGLSWAFHLTFTIYFLFQGQPDLAAAGRVFSLPLIWLGNIFILVLLLLVFIPELRLQDFLTPCWNRCTENYIHLSEVFP